MNRIWLWLFFLSVLTLTITNPETIIKTMMQQSTDCVSYCINLFAVYAIWLGILEIIEKSGITFKLSKKISPIISKLFKSENKEANKYIAINLSSNMLGIGSVATPSGIKAMELLDNKSGKITFSAIMLLILNSASLSFVPTTCIGIRESAQSINSASIILPTIITSFVSAILGVLLVFVFFYKPQKILKTNTQTCLENEDLT